MASSCSKLPSTHGKELSISQSIFNSSWSCLRSTVSLLLLSWWTFPANSSKNATGESQNALPLLMSHAHHSNDGAAGGGTSFLCSRWKSFTALTFAVLQRAVAESQSLLLFPVQHQADMTSQREHKWEDLFLSTISANSSCFQAQQCLHLHKSLLNCNGLQRRERHRDQHHHCFLHCSLQREKFAQWIQGPASPSYCPVSVTCNIQVFFDAAGIAKTDRVWKEETVPLTVWAVKDKSGITHATWSKLSLHPWFAVSCDFDPCFYGFI